MADAPTIDSLIEANAAFYRAFESLDLPALEKAWDAGDRLFCVHPGWQALSGREAVMDSWRAILANTGKIAFTLTRVEARIAGTVGIVTLYENIDSQVGNERHRASAIATNLFRYDQREGGWKLFHHHASLAAAPDGKMAVN